MTFAEAEKFVYSLINLRRKEYMNDPRHCGIYLKRVLFLLDLIGNPQNAIPHYIHVTGTSGKGSVCRFLHTILHAAGHKTGMLTSPHATSITERWTVNGTHMSKKEFAQIVSWIKPIVDEYMRTSPYDMVSYAELMTVIGLHYFAMHEVTHAVIEVACGGRYDATNSIPRKDAAIITNIGLDHTNIWPTKKDIAIEKSGIITCATARAYTAESPGVFQDIICKEAKKQHVPITTVSPKNISLQDESLSGTTFAYAGTSYAVSALGKHQAYNAALAIAVMKDFGIPEQDIRKGLHRTMQPTRMEIIATDPYIILDSAHNPDKIKSTVQTLQRLFADTKRPIHLLIGFSADKSLASMTKHLRKLSPTHVVCTRQTTNSYRKVHDPHDIATHFPDSKTASFLDPVEALSSAQTRLGHNGILLITGSTFIAGELRPYLTIRARSVILSTL